MRYSLINKRLVIGIFIIFITIVFLPVVNSKIIQLEKQKEVQNEDDKINHQMNKNLIEYCSPKRWSTQYCRYGISKEDFKGIKKYDSKNDLAETIENFECLYSRGNYTPHDPIIIFGDDDFTEENGVTGGNGTASDPYIIEDWEIDTTSFTAIYISGTTSYFIIRNCLLKNAIYGINLWEVPVGSVTDCQILLNQVGLGLFLSSNIVLRNNILYENFYNLEIFGLKSSHYYHNIDTSNVINGKPVYYIINESGLIFDGSDDIGYLGLIGCDDILVSGLTINNSGDGVLLVDTFNSIIAYSTFTKCYFGISLFESSNNMIINCKLTDSSLYIINSSNNMFRNNTITDIWGVGVFGYTLENYYQDFDTSNIVNDKPVYYLVEEEDMVFNETDVGFLALVNCKNIVVEDVNVSNNWFSIEIVETDAIFNNCETSYNDIGLFVFGNCNLEINSFKTFYNNFGCILSHASNVEIKNCDIAGFIGCIQIDYTHDVKINKCIFRESNNNAVILFYCWNIDIKDNEFLVNDGYCIVLFENCMKNIISYNNFQGYCGIDIHSGSQNNTISYNKINNLVFCGIYLYQSDNNIVHHNSIHDIDGDEYAAGIMIYRSEGCKIYQNNIYGNTRGLEANFCNEVNAKRNWWGSKDGPSGIGSGSGDSIEVYESTVLFEPWLKRPVSKSKQLNYSYLGMFMRFLERFPLLKQFFSIFFT